MSGKNKKQKPLTRTRTKDRTSNGIRLPLIIGISIGAAVLIAAAAICIYLFVLRPGHTDQTSGTSATEALETGGQDTTEASTEAGSEQTGTEAGSEPVTETSASDETGAEVQPAADSEYAEDITGIIQEMTLEEKVDQLFIVTPLALVRTLSEVDAVNTVGETTQAAYKANPVGGILVSTENLEWTDDSYTSYKLDQFAAFTSAFNNLSLSFTNAPLFIFIEASECKALQLPEMTSYTEIDDSTLKNYGISGMFTADDFKLTNADSVTDALAITGGFMKGYEDNSSGSYGTKAATQKLYLDNNATDTYPMLTEGIASVSDPSALKEGIRGTEGSYDKLLLGCPIDTENNTMDAGTQATNLFLSGADMLICKSPEAFSSARSAILTAVQNGTGITEQDIELSLTRILTAKLKLAGGSSHTAASQPAQEQPAQEQQAQTQPAETAAGNAGTAGDTITITGNVSAPDTASPSGEGAADNGSGTDAAAAGSGADVSPVTIQDDGSSSDSN